MQTRRTDNPPMISVVTCCYNQGRYLRDCFESVLGQQYPNFEHIVVDDGSTDNTREVCESYKHVRYIYQKNAGQSAALNRGFQEAKGDIIAWVNSDDYFSPQAFYRVVREMEPSQGRWIVSGAAKVVNEDGHYMWMLRNGHVTFHRLLLHPRIYPYNGWTVMPCQPSVFFHRAVYEKIGPLDTKYKYGMDFEYWLRAMRAGYSFHYVPQIFSNYRYHATSHSNQGFDTFLGEWEDIMNRYLALLSPFRRFLIEAWWKIYVRPESLIVQRHKEAIQHIAKRFGRAPRFHPMRKRVAVLARAVTIAPWIPLTLAWRMVNKELPEPEPTRPTRVHVPTSHDGAPLVSVIMPVFNSGIYLEGSVQSVLGQSYSNFELFMVDDGSADDSLLIARRLATRDPARITVLRHPDGKNHGVSETRNLGLLSARGKYVAFLDADDRWLPSKLEAQVAYMEAHPEVGLTYTKSRIIREGEGHQFIPGVETLGAKPPKGRQITMLQIIQVSLNYVFSSVMVRADCLHAVGDFAEKLPYQSEDRLMVAKVSTDHEIALVPEVLCDYLAHPSNYSVKAVKGGIIPAVFFDMRVRMMKWLHHDNNKPLWAKQIAARMLPDSFVAALLCSSQPRIRANVMENLSEVLKIYPHYLPLFGFACVRHSRIGNAFRIMTRPFTKKRDEEVETAVAAE